jgi:hypothetical protein
MNEPLNSPTNTDDKPDLLLKAIACCFPIVGVVLYALWRTDKPKSANAAGLWAIIGFVGSIILGILFYVLVIILSIMVPLLDFTINGGY